MQSMRRLCLHPCSLLPSGISLVTRAVQVVAILLRRLAKLPATFSIPDEKRPAFLRGHFSLRSSAPTRLPPYRRSTPLRFSRNKVTRKHRKGFRFLVASKSICSHGATLVNSLCPHQESNLDLSLRRATLDPLSYGGCSVSLIHRRYK